jgi:hypothetical protein
MFFPAVFSAQSFYGKDVVVVAVVDIKGPYTRVRIRVRFPVRFHEQFAYKPDRDPILHQTPITMVCLQISAKID